MYAFYVKHTIFFLKNRVKNIHKSIYLELFLEDVKIVFILYIFKSRTLLKKSFTSDILFILIHTFLSNTILSIFSFIIQSNIYYIYLQKFKLH
jgi:hypothetical protein